MFLLKTKKKMKMVIKAKNNFCIPVLCVLLMGLLSSNSYGETYDPLGRKDPFVPLIGVSKSQAEYGIKGILTSDDAVLQGITINTGGNKSIILNGEIVGEGDRRGIVFVEKIEDNEVHIIIDDERHVLKLYE